MKKTVLYVATNEIQLLDLPKRLDEMGYLVYTASLNISVDGYNDSACKRLEEVIAEYNPGYVISYDFVESVSRACFLRDVPYIAWVYDSPQKELYTKDAFNSCNYIVVFDKAQQKRLIDIGLKNVIHEQLAIHAGKISRDIDLITDEDDSYDISFVGQLYKYDNLDTIYDKAPEDVKREVDGIFESCFMKWGDDLSIYGTLSDKAIEYFIACDNKIISNVYPYMSNRFFYESAIISRMLANRERVHILNRLAQAHKMYFFTFDKNLSQLHKDVNIQPGAKYDYEVSKIYNRSRININLTLHSIESGASQRVFDVMGAGGFLISNYQKELTELFEEDKEIVLFRNEEELLKKIDYYLSHEEERKAIALRGQKKVLSSHDFSDGLNRVINYVDIDIKRKDTSFFDTAKKELINQSCECLHEHTRDAFIKLLGIMNQPKNETVIKHDTQLDILKSIVDLSGLAYSENLFGGIYSVEDAYQIYTRIKHFAWRCETGIIDDTNESEVVELLNHNDYMMFWSYIVFKEVDKADITICRMADLIEKTSPVKAMEFIESGLSFFAGNRDIILKKSEILLKYGCYKEALSCLKALNDPGDEIDSIIKELEKIYERNESS